MKAEQDANIQEEVAWQEAALAVAFKTPEPTRDVFAQIAGTPMWLKVFLEENEG